MIERPRDAVFREVEDPVCGPDDVVVRSRAAGVCRTDLEILAGELDPRWVRFPVIPGHEWSGTIAEVGATSMADLGRVMADVMPQIAGRADGSVVSQIVREKLA